MLRSICLSLVTTLPTVHDPRIPPSTLPSICQFQCGGCLFRQVNLVLLTVFRILDLQTFARTLPAPSTVDTSLRNHRPV
ncbi:hypothetical protein BDQ94DRAFT_146513 [Aspergillus welwitschiae]|uniref:Uncharacterized protein n=1 Tax=Aspergillus welwitschiae TaxID=1341132 RepID=A0A3F3PXX6_9EURO|nr:hypothetical protein BDQ94DRAFT_146513 [Aspergillus welwitschiae]RDH31718.1 hypothetical protein BDQ94DRAFT_146513 [Aspergillus welwitschiae]